MKLDVTYRGSLASCDYACNYCPFAKKHDDADARTKDQETLDRFVKWVESRSHVDNIRILFTPWGEALVRKWYRSAIVKLSHMAHVQKVVVQTNLSVPVEWLRESNPTAVALWTTFHPTETTLSKFITQTNRLDEIGIKHSVGIVGKKEHRDITISLRDALNNATYLWVNAYKDDQSYYSQEDIEFYQSIDPLFEINNQNYPSFGKQCRSGSTSISVDAEGNVKPCHFINHNMGNIFEQDIHDILQKDYRCSNEVCDCYIGYIHLNELRLEEKYGDRIIERIPVNY